MYLCKTIKRALIMIDNMKNIEFLNKLSNILIKKISPAVTTGEINKLFINFLGIEDTEFVIWDNNNMLLKNFSQDLKIFDDKNQSNENNYIYTNLAVSGGVKFYFNETEFDCGLKDDEFDGELKGEEFNRPFIDFDSIKAAILFYLINLWRNLYMEYNDSRV